MAKDGNSNQRWIIHVLLAIVITILVALGQWAWSTIAQYNRDIEILDARIEYQLAILKDQKQEIKDLRDSLARLGWYVEKRTQEKLPSSLTRPPH